MRGALRVSPQKLRALLDSKIGSSTYPSPDFSALIKLGQGHCYNKFSTRVSDYKPRYPSHNGFPSYNGLEEVRVGNKTRSIAVIPSEVHQITKKDDQVVDQKSMDELVPIYKQRFGASISKVEKRKFLINTLMDLDDSKKAVYGTLDAWVAWEQKFPLHSLKKALAILEKEHQWHRIVQIIKWMLSKGQGITVKTYEQLIHALEKDGRAEEAHYIWVKKLSHDMPCVPWQVCSLMISIYYRNDMLERLVKLFKRLESYDRKPPNKAIVRKVADAHEMLGYVEEKNRILEKYNDLFLQPSELFKKRKASRKKKLGTENDKSLETDPVRFLVSDTENDKSLEASDNGLVSSLDGESEAALKIITS